MKWKREKDFIRKKLPPLLSYYASIAQRDWKKPWKSWLWSLSVGPRFEFQTYCTWVLTTTPHSMKSIYEGCLKNSWTHLINPSRNITEVRWRSLFRSTCLGKRCTSYNAPPTSRKRKWSNKVESTNFSNGPRSCSAAILKRFLLKRQ
jgi:hypothetical protein